MNISQRGHDIQASRSGNSSPTPTRPKPGGSRSSTSTSAIPTFPPRARDGHVPPVEPARPRLRAGPGLLELREAVTRYFAKYDIPLGPDEVLITTGGSEAIHFTFSVIGDVGDEIVIPEPYYTTTTATPPSPG